MLARLLGLGRPVATAAEVASRVTGIAGLEASLLSSSAVASPLLRDGGRNASTSYGACGLVGHNLHHLVRRYLLVRPHATTLLLPNSQAPQTWTPHPQLRSYSIVSSTLTASSAQQSLTASVAVRLASTAGDPSHLPISAANATSLSSAVDPNDSPHDPIRGLDMESLLRVLLHPLPLGRKQNPALFSGAAAPVVQLGREALFFDPASTLSSTMRALHVIRSVLRADGHVLVLNPNPAMRPLLREAAYLCLNRNVWFWSHDWQPGALSDTGRSMAAVLDPHYCQPNRRLMAARGLSLRNPLCPPGSLEHSRIHPLPKLSDEDVRRLEAGRRAPSRMRHDRERARDHRVALEALATARAREARLLPAGVQPAVGRGGHADRLALVVALGLSYGGDAVREAAERKIPTVSLLNGHSDTAHVTFPVYASESHAGFQHFFLEWLLRVVNLPPPPPQQPQ